MDRCGLIWLACQFKAATVRRVEARDHIEKGGLACAIGTNEAVDLTSLNGHANIGQSLQSTKAFGNASHF